VQEYDEYDDKLNLVAWHKPGENQQSVILGYNNTLRIAEVSNAEYAFHTSFEDIAAAGCIPTSKARTGQKVFSGSYTINIAQIPTGDYVLTYWKSMDSGSIWTKVTENVTVTGSTLTKTIGGNCWIDEVRIMPPAARMKTYTYQPGHGKTSEMDHNGRVTYREYDDFGRLTKIFNNDRQVIKEYRYNFSNQ
jgi:YD repeat-containing protein